MRNIILFFLFAVLFISCKKNEEIKVGFLLPNFTDSRYIKDRDFFSAKFKSLGGAVEVGNAENDDYKQAAQAEEMFKKGVKVIVIASINVNTAASIVRKAKSKGVKVIAYERLIRNADIDCYLTFDHYQVGKIQAQYALNKSPQGNYVIIGGDKRDYNAELIMKGQMEVLAKAGNSIRIIYKTYVEDWLEENAYYEVSKVLDLCNTNVDVVLTANDGMASGAIRALKEIQPDYPVITTGLDADREACKRILFGTQSMTVYKSFKLQAEIAAELAYKLIRNEKLTEAKAFIDNGYGQIPSIMLVPTGVDQSNIQNTIIADGFYTEKQLQE